MNPILADIYSTILPSAPYLIGAYALLWVILLAYIFIIQRGLKRAEKDMALLEEHLDDIKRNNREGGRAYREEDELVLLHERSEER